MLGSAWVYDRWFQREPTRLYSMEIAKLRRIYEVVQVVCYSPPHDMLRRLSYQGDTDWTLKEITKVQELFLEWHTESSKLLPSILVNTADTVGIKAAAASAVEQIHDIYPTFPDPRGTLEHLPP